MALEAEKVGTIKNRQTRQTDGDGKVWVLSEYAFIPASPDEDWQTVAVSVDASGQQAFI